MNVLKRCSRDVCSLLLCLPWWKKNITVSCKLLPGPVILLCGVVPGKGFLRALLTMFASLEIELFSEEVGTPKRKCLSLEPPHFAKLHIYTRASDMTLLAPGLSRSSLLLGRRSVL